MSWILRNFGQQSFARDILDDNNVVRDKFELEFKNYPILADTSNDEYVVIRYDPLKKLLAQ